VLLAPSTLRWAAHQVAERVADVLDVTDRLLSALFSPARRLLRIRA
jgi:phosphoenolpyruvate-protein kinase (PTS system EI component)